MINLHNEQTKIQVQRSENFLSLENMQAYLSDMEADFKKTLQHLFYISQRNENRESLGRFVERHWPKLKVDNSLSVPAQYEDPANTGESYISLNLKYILDSLENKKNSEKSIKLFIIFLYAHELAHAMHYMLGDTFKYLTDYNQREDFAVYVSGILFELYVTRIFNSSFDEEEISSQMNVINMYFVKNKIVGQISSGHQSGIRQMNIFYEGLRHAQVAKSRKDGNLLNTAFRAMEENI